ncbi:2-oxo acid dehydrogenase subunit E2 [uncultured Sunxiuqinia sp.]|uniref:2-oxo acid dehydrogenase subunit E2 n=1 Tax=uncultured Sunxiuqinia sp. TaxID=1573825 RepID=UPI002AA70085|nr:2-oxo acid dehydrogenase subunit E2 [uncultured Sunxiuqinia sp.]
MKKEIKVPDIAENVETGLIAGILVSKGDKVVEDQSVVEIETDKATTDIPSPFVGTVNEIKVSEGDEVEVNQVIMIIETEGEESQDNEEDESDDEASDQDKENKKSAEKEEQVDDSDSDSEEEETDEEEDGLKEKSSGKEKNDQSDIPASPSVRRLAREKDIDLDQVEGTGPSGRITTEDVEQFAGKSDSDQANDDDKKANKTKESKREKELSTDFAKWGLISMEPMNNIRKETAKNVQQAWQTVPHVTQFDEADITNLENFRKQNQDKIAKSGGKLTVTALLLKIASLALQRFPRFNASLDEENNQIVYKHYYHIGIAVDTSQGLLVPVIRDVNKKSLSELAAELSEMAEKARDKKISSDEMQGGSFTISNLGGIGGTQFTPIVYSPQVAILGVSRSQYKQVLVNDEFEQRLVIPLSLSYDHRVIDGADGARFLRWICDVIEDPFSILQ